MRTRSEARLADDADGGEVVRSDAADDFLGRVVLVRYELDLVSDTVVGQEESCDRSRSTPYRADRDSLSDEVLERRDAFSLAGEHPKRLDGDARESDEV